MAKKQWREHPLVDDGYWNFYNGIYTGETAMPGRMQDPVPYFMVKLMETAAEKAPGPGIINLRTPDGAIHSFDAYPLELCPPADLAAKVGHVVKDGAEDLKAAAAYVYQIKELVMGPAFFTFDELMDLGPENTYRLDADFDLRLLKARYRSLDIVETVWKAVTADWRPSGTYSPEQVKKDARDAGLTEEERIMDDDDRYWLLTNDTCRRFIEDYNESHTDKISVIYGHYTRKDEIADMKRMGAE